MKIKNVDRVKELAEQYLFHMSQLEQTQILLRQINEEIKNQFADEYFTFAFSPSDGTIITLRKTILNNYLVVDMVELL